MNKRLIRQSDNTNITGELKQLNDIITHKKFILDSANLMCKYFIRNNNLDMALKILKIAIEHDISKSNKDEFLVMSKYILNKDPEEKKNIAKLHYKRNKHHPEYWKDLNTIDEISIIEMSIDFYARSWQFGTDPVEYITQQDRNRFNFPKSVLNKIIKYLNIMKKESN